MTKIAIVPSMQFHNQYICANRVEGEVMGAYGQRVVDLLNQFGAPSIQAQRFWSENESIWTDVADAAAAWSDYVVAFHTDSAGDKRGCTGSLLCYGDNAEGRRMGQTIQARMTSDFGWPNAGEVNYQDKLYMMNLGTPSCLLEIGNHSDPDDCAVLLNESEKFCRAIAWGIFNFLGIEPAGPTTGEEDMSAMLVRNKQDGKVYLVDFGASTRRWITNPDELTWLVSTCGLKLVEAPVMDYIGDNNGFKDLDAVQQTDSEIAAAMKLVTVPGACEEVATNLSAEALRAIGRAVADEEARRLAS